MGDAEESTGRAGMRWVRDCEDGVIDGEAAHPEWV